MKTYEIDYYKTENLSPDELNAMRSNQRGIWLVGERVSAESPRKAIIAAKQVHGSQKVRLANR